MQSWLGRGIATQSTPHLAQCRHLAGPHQVVQHRQAPQPHGHQLAARQGCEGGKGGVGSIGKHRGAVTLPGALPGTWQRSSAASIDCRRVLAEYR